MSRAYYYKLMIFIKAEYLSYLIIKITDIVPVSLLTESAEMIKILSDL